MSGLTGEPPAITNLSLSRTTEAVYGEYARKSRHNECWWYFNGLAPYRRFSRPFRGAEGRWWYCVKPGFAWPISYFHPFPPGYRGPGRRALLGWQHPVDAAIANSSVSMNVIRNLGAYGWDTLSEAKQRAVRKGFRNLCVVSLDPRSSEDCRGACDVWNSHVQRTGWNRPMTPPELQEAWRELADWPGTTVFGARRKDSGLICAFLIARCIDETIFVDTLASHTGSMNDRPNDTLVYAAIRAASFQGLLRAHYSLCSRIESLESFKRSMGFEPWSFPARLTLRFPVGWLLKQFRPDDYRRLRGGPPCTSNGQKTEC